MLVEDRAAIGMGAFLGFEIYLVRCSQRVSRRVYCRRRKKLYYR